MSPPAHGTRRKPGHKSCDACKAVKLRCVRDGGDGPCERCLASSQECRMPEARPRKYRSGQRLELAKMLYGDQGRQVEQGSISPRYDGLSEHSPESMISAMEFRGQLSVLLMEEYLDVSQYPLPVRSWKDFRADFELSGKRLESLANPMSQVLAATLIAGGALVTSAPCVLGDGISGIDVSEGDLINFGRRRQGIYDALMERAINLADQKGALRYESNESVAILTMLSYFLDHGDVCRRKGRPYRVAAVSHACSIAEDGEPLQDWLEIVAGPLGWLLFIQDTWSAASSLTTPTLGEADERQVCPFMNDTLPTMNELSHSLGAVQAHEDVWWPVGMMWSYLTRLMKNVNYHLRTASPSARTWSVLEDAYKKLDDCKKTLELFQFVLSQSYVTARPNYPQLRHYFSTLPIPVALVTFYIHRAIMCWTDAPSDFGLFLPETVLSLQNFKTESQRRIGEDARNLAKMFHSLRDILPYRTSVVFVPGMAMLFETLPVWADHLCAVPTDEDDVMSTYSRQEKIQEMGWFLDALYSLGWSYADDSLAGAIAKLEGHLTHSA